MVAANCAVAPSSTDAEAGETVSTISLLTVTLAVALFVLSAWLVAWMMTDPCAGMSCGAV